MGVFVLGWISYSFEIEAPIGKVFSFYADPRFLEKTVPGGSKMKVAMTSEGPLAVGSTWQISGDIGGKNVVFEEEYIEFEENQKLTWRQAKGDMRKRIEGVEFTKIEGGTQVKRSIEYKLPYWLLGWVLDRLRVKKDLENFMMVLDEVAKEIIEGKVEEK